MASRDSRATSGAPSGASIAPLTPELSVAEVPRVFVFGSNLAGRHGKGAALFALRERGAIYGVGEGRQRGSYAIPTKDERLRTLPLAVINRYVNAFLFHAMCTSRDVFELTPIGCGLAGYKPEQIAPMFRDAPPNVILPDEFRRVLGNTGSRTASGEAAAPSPDAEVGPGRTK